MNKSIIKIWYTIIQFISNLKRYNPNLDHQKLLSDLKVMMGNYNPINNTKIKWHSKSRDRKTEYKVLLEKYPQESDEICEYLHQPFNIQLKKDIDNNLTCDFEKLVEIAVYIGLFVGVSSNPEYKEIREDVLDTFQYHILSNIYHYVSDKELSRIEVSDDLREEFIKNLGVLAKDHK